MQDLDEQLLDAWIKINGTLKDTRTSKDLPYNQAIILKFLYDQYKIDGIGRVSFQTLIEKTNFVKSLVNRTVDQLSESNLVIKIKEGKNAYAQLVSENLETFLKIHENSLRICNEIIAKIGVDDTNALIRAFNEIFAMNKEGTLEL